jgi:xanthine dehydrogenase accessory factor
VNVYAELARRLAAGEACGLATVVHTEGSAPGQPAMKMLVAREGRPVGTVGGGRVEAEVAAAARDALRTGRPRLFTFTLSDDLADEGGLLCGGTVRILVERVDPPAPWAAEAAEARGAALLARLLPDRVERSLLRGEAARPYLADETPRLEGDLFVEPLVTPRAIVLGAGHVGRLAAELAACAGFDVAVVDDRPDHARPGVVCAPLVEGFESLCPGPDDYVVVVTRGAGLDLACCRAALRSGARYVGMLGSRRKAAAVREALASEGADLRRLHAPIGLDLGAVSAGEIALSIVAQMIKVRRTGRGDR